jgi:antitoxin ParD1/3/4
VRPALRLFEQEENQKKELVKELKKGEKSGFIPKFEHKKFLKTLHGKHLSNEL